MVKNMTESERAIAHEEYLFYTEIQNGLVEGNDVEYLHELSRKAKVLSRRQATYFAEKGKKPNRTEVEYYPNGSEKLDGRAAKIDAAMNADAVADMMYYLEHGLPNETVSEDMGMGSM